jgi:hypothetical protein
VTIIIRYQLVSRNLKKEKKAIARAVGQPNLFPLMFQQPLSQSAALGLILTLSGFFILSAGFILVINYDRQRSWHLRQIEKLTQLKSRKISIRTTDEIFERPTQEKERS